MSRSQRPPRRLLHLRRDDALPDPAALRSDRAAGDPGAPGGRSPSAASPRSPAASPSSTPPPAASAAGGCSPCSLAVFPANVHMAVNPEQIRGLDLRQDPALGALGAAAAAAAGDALGLARDRRFSPEVQGTQGVSARGPSRSRPWLAVTVPETAGDVRSGGIAQASATGSSRECHGSAPEAPVTPLPDGRRPAVFLIRLYDGFRTPQGLRCSLLGHPKFRTPQELRCSLVRHGRISDTARTFWFEWVVWRPSRTTE